MSIRSLVPEPTRERVRATVLALGTSTQILRATPDFIVAGAQRCGTTSLFRALVEHPQVVRPAFHKGVNYFDLNYFRDESWYRAHFPIRRVAGVRTRRYGPPAFFEASGYYLYHPFAMERLARDLPEAKIVVMLRDPVERAYSAYQHEQARGYERESFETALALEDDRLVGEEDRMRRDPAYESFTHRHHSYRHRGQYAEQLRRLYSLIPRHRVHVMQSENFFADPASEFRMLTDFLGLPSFQPGRFDQYNARPRDPMTPETRMMLTRHYAAHDESLAGLIGEVPAWRR
jgi:hypothetical protein